MYDVFGRSVSGLTDQTSTPTTFNDKYWFFNGYALTLNDPTLFANLDISYVNWMVSDSGGNDATDFPTLMRISG